MLYPLLTRFVGEGRLENGWTRKTRMGIGVGITWWQVRGAERWASGWASDDCVSLVPWARFDAGLRVVARIFLAPWTRALIAVVVRVRPRCH